MTETALFKLMLEYITGQAIQQHMTLAQQAQAEAALRAALDQSWHQGFGVGIAVGFAIAIGAAIAVRVLTRVIAHEIRDFREAAKPDLH